MAILNNSNAISTGGYDINNSLRFRSSASAYLNRTPASASNRSTYTWSAWVKRGSLGNYFTLFGAGTTSPTYDVIRFNSSDQLEFFTAGAASVDVVTTQVFRDPSAWYHIVVAVDTTQATAANRVKFYINGSQVTAFASASYPVQNSTNSINNTVPHAVGATSVNATFNTFLDGYIAEQNFIDGQQLTPSSFGSTNSTTGVWQPAKYTGTYGTNGFYLKFSDIATTSGSNAGLGKDFSGNGNYWNTTNISVTSGTTYDAMTDVPTLTSATVANYATLNPLKLYSTTAGTYSNANLSFSGPNTTNWYAAQSSITMSSGKWYFEATIVTATSSNNMVGIAPVSSTNANVGVESNTYAYMGANGNKQNNNTQTAYGATYTANDVIGVAFDATAGTLIFYKNNVSQGTAFTGITGEYAFTVACNPNTIAVNFGQRPFTYTPPSGFVALNTYNLPDSTIKKGNKYMDATLYTGTATTQSITNAGSFKPDLVWVKIRSGAGQHVLSDSVRGISKQVFSSLTNAETTETGKGITAFNSNGFTLGDELVVTGSSNANAATYVGWQWQAGQGSTSSNTSGSITSTVSVNTSAGFSVVTYTGNGVNATVGHGLGVAPKFIIVKNRGVGTTNWEVYHSALTGTSALYLNTTEAKQTFSDIWNNTNPTSTVISLGTTNNVNANTNTYVAYCWAEIAGFSKFTSYTGNGSADGPFVYFGFRPRFIMIKRTDAATSWFIHDTARDTYNVTNLNLYPNLSAAEELQTTWNLDMVSNGIKIRGTSTELNASGGTYIVAAFAENPFKNANAR